MHYKLPLFLFAFLFAANVVAAQDATPEMTPEAALEPGPDLITIATPGLMPEGIAYDPANDTLLIGSLSQATINRVDWEGNLTPLADSENLISTVGLEVDTAHNRVLAAGLTAQMNGATLAAYDLNTGEELILVDLAALTPDAARHFTNDVTVDADGNAYVTDSFAGVIYKVTPEGEASIFLQDESFGGQFTLNGIAFHPDGYLVAVRSTDLLKIPLDSPDQFSVIMLTGTIGSGGDGIIFADPQTLILANSGGVYRLHSDDDWTTATVTGTAEVLPETSTTVAVRGDEVYVVYANFQNPQAEEYHIQKVAFQDAGM